MQAHNPFFPKHTMKFKTGGSSFMPALPGGKGWKESVFNPAVPAQQTKNILTKGEFATDAKIKADEAAALAAGQQPLPNTQAASMASLVQAQQDLIQKEASKKSIRKTIFAGETGGFGGMKPYGSAATGMAGKVF